KRTLGLESYDQQIALFENLSAEEQRQALADSLDDADAMQDEIRRMHALWRAGDGEGLFEETGAELKEKYPAVYQRLNSDRNLAWLPRLRAMLDDSDSDDSLVVVGAMHLLGEDGVVE